MYCCNLTHFVYSYSVAKCRRFVNSFCYFLKKIIAMLCRKRDERCTLPFCFFSPSVTPLRDTVSLRRRAVLAHTGTPKTRQARFGEPLPREPPNLDKLGSGNPYHVNSQNLLRVFRDTKKDGNQLGHCPFLSYNYQLLRRLAKSTRIFKFSSDK